MPIELTDEMAQAINNALVERMPCLMATASRDGMPDIGYRGSMMAFDKEHLAYWERSKGESLANLEENPKIVVMYRNPTTRLGWRFYGTATIHRDGDLRQQVMERVVQFELDQDPERQGYAIVIRVDRVRARNDTIMVRDE